MIRNWVINAYDAFLSETNRCPRKATFSVDIKYRLWERLFGLAPTVCLSNEPWFETARLGVVVQPEAILWVEAEGQVFLLLEVYCVLRYSDFVDLPLGFAALVL